MSSILITSTPVVGHITPLLPVAQQLVEAGHRVRILTGARYRDAVESTGATFVALPAAAGSRSAAVGPAAGAPPAGRPRHRMSGCAAVPPLVTTDRARGEGPSRPRGRVRDAGRGLPACPGNRAVALGVVQ